MGFQAASAGFSAAGAYGEAKSKRAGLGYEEASAYNAAAVAGYQASDALRTGQIEEQTQDLKTAAVFSAQRANMAANGIDLGEGSASEVLTTTQVMGQRDAATIHDNTMRAVWGYRVQQESDLSNAHAYAAMKKGIKPYMAVAGSLLGSAKGSGAKLSSMGSGSGGAGSGSGVSAGSSYFSAGSVA